MADSQICEQILKALKEGEVTVPTHGAFRYQADIKGSSRSVKKALGSLIRQGLIRRHRPEPTGCSDIGQEITFELSEH